MKRVTFIVGMAAIALLFCTTNGNAQSRIVRRATPPTRGNNRVVIIERDRHIDVRDLETAPRIIGHETVRAFEVEDYDVNRISMAEMIFRTGGAVTAAQATAIAQAFDYDSNRLKFLKMAYLNCVDRHNYYFTLKTFDYSSNLNSLADYVYKMESENPEYRIYFRASNEYMKEILGVFREAAYDSSRIKIGRMILYGGEFTAKQIAEIAKTFDYDSNRLKFLLSAYNHCIDGHNYLIAANTLEYSSNRKKLMDNIAR